MKPNWFNPKQALRGHFSAPARGLPLANDQGLTLIECLVAIVMVALIASAITPALIISVATRVQSQKAEQALRIAQSEVDRVRSLAEQIDGQNQSRLREVNTANTATFIPSAPAAITEANIANQPGPARGAPVARNALSTVNQTFPQALNGNDFAVQVYRTRGLTRNGVPVAFALGVRVYDVVAVNSPGAGNLSAVPLSLAVRGDAGRRSERPLAVLYTNIAIAEDGNSLCNLIRYTDAGGTASTPLGCLP